MRFCFDTSLFHDCLLLQDRSFRKQFSAPQTSAGSDTHHLRSRLGNTAKGQRPNAEWPSSSVGGRRRYVLFDLPIGSLPVSPFVSRRILSLLMKSFEEPWGEVAVPVDGASGMLMARYTTSAENSCAWQAAGINPRRIATARFVALISCFVPSSLSYVRFAPLQ